MDTTGPIEHDVVQNWLCLNSCCSSRSSWTWTEKLFVSDMESKRKSNQTLKQIQWKHWKSRKRCETGQENKLAGRSGTAPTRSRSWWEIYHHIGGSSIQGIFQPGLYANKCWPSPYKHLFSVPLKPRQGTTPRHFTTNNWLQKDTCTITPKL